MPDRVKLTRTALRAHALGQTLFRAPDLTTALHRFGFVQADPIRAPARAQDLTLRHRIDGYRAGDLERQYPELGIEEGLFYAYGFLTRQLWALRHPPERSGLSKPERRLLELVMRVGEAHPEDLQAEFGGKRARNAWGGYSTAAKLALERLHRRGLLRVARRQKGVRVYAPSLPCSERPAPNEVLSTFALTVAGILGPISERSLRALLAQLARPLTGAEPRAVLSALAAAARLESGEFEGIKYLWLAPGTVSDGVEALPPPDTPAEPVPRTVRLLAPFDPVVWDRRRFEHLWGWAYRFEAYTPIAKRVRGYYALPLAWGDDIIGWANVARTDSGVDAELGFVGKRPRERAFRLELEAELSRLREFLRGPEDDAEEG